MIEKISHMAMTIFIGLALISIATGAQAHQAEAGTYKVDAPQAKKLARHYLDDLGFSRAGTSVYRSASVGKAILQNDTWIVQVMTGHRLPSKKAVVLVNAQTGDIKQSLEK